jgi:hypothetical protein
VGATPINFTVIQSPSTSEFGVADPNSSSTMPLHSPFDPVDLPKNKEEMENVFPSHSRQQNNHEIDNKTNINMSTTADLSNFTWSFEMAANNINNRNNSAYIGNNTSYNEQNKNPDTIINNTNTNTNTNTNVNTTNNNNTDINTTNNDSGVDGSIEADQQSRSVHKNDTEHEDLLLVTPFVEPTKNFNTNDPNLRPGDSNPNRDSAPFFDMF